MTTFKLTTVVLLWLVALWRLPAAIRLPKQRAMWVAFTGLALAATTSIPSVGLRIDTVTGFNNASVLARQLVGIVAIGAVLDFVIAMARPNLLRASRTPNLLVGVAVMAAMTALFSNVPQPTRVENFYDAYHDSATAAGYSLSFVIYLALATAVASWMCFSYSRDAARSWLRAGLRLLGAGTGIGTVYSLFRAAHLVSRLFSFGFPLGDAAVQQVADVIEYGAIALIIIGNCIAPVGVLKAAAADWRAVRRLKPLWASLTEAVPEVVLPTTVRRRPRIRLHRVVIEIRDASRTLSAYATEPARAQAYATASAQGCEGEQLALTAEALWLRGARQARLEGVPLTEAGEPPNPVGDQLRSPELEPEGLDFDTEVQRLTQLSIAYHSSAALTIAAQPAAS
ncbi:MAB_1171c family putative transporter [Streptomyces sp. NPDC057910]|uniref:MAB_1171c family putative transporter n=1 Tax=Streptomyces sp. NPDC057910 TaxID=3346278 RepID=UPI0036EC2BA7